MRYRPVHRARDAFVQRPLFCFCRYLAALWLIANCSAYSNTQIGPTSFTSTGPRILRENYTVIDASSTNDTENGTTFITFLEGDHFPTVVFPFGEIGGLVFPVTITAYLFLCLTIVCDCFLVPCIQGISTALDWSPDVAGATLMAAASSSPELFVNILATFLTKSDVGVGTVLGTGLFALLIVPALCILFTSYKMLKLDYWPITRDALAYLVALLTLVAILADKEIQWYEAAILISIYLLYLLVLYSNDTLRFKFETLMSAIHRRRAAGRLIEPILPLLQKPGRLPISMSVEDVFYVLEDHTPEFYTMAQWPKHRSFWAKLEWLLMWPIITILRLTIPTFWNSDLSILYIITFAVCVAWIGLLCYCISWMITLIGNELSMPESVMGLTLLAAGMSIPETISGVIVANQGYGTMALSNALGSNTFAILMCLGVPWLIKISFFEQSHIGSITISSGGIEYTACIVVFALIVVFTILLMNRFRLKVKSGWTLVMLYVVFIGFAIYIELQFFWHEKAH